MISDYCGYCGRDFERAASAPVEICARCLSDPQTAAAYEQDNAYALAEAAHEAEQAREAREYY